MSNTWISMPARSCAGGEPFEPIMDSLATFRPGQGLRIYATFKPTPLFHVLGSRGFSHQEIELEGGEWEVLFIPAATAAKEEFAEAAHSSDADWPKPVREMDNRDLDPPKPMVRVLAAVEEAGCGEVVSSLLCREPVFLLPELAKRGHQWRGAFLDDGATYRVEIRVSGRSRS